ncbi:MAG: glycoside hydrolase family 57 protein [Planctomycetes bacterium]|nr:glycoside hydrolase family 57 protein [Planctomycetota bacterium]
MTDVTVYFQVHQPFRLRRYTFFDIGTSEAYFDDAENERIVRRVAERCYLPMNALVRRLIGEHAGRFRVSYSISGTALEQLERWAPEALASFQELAATGCVEVLAETSHHSLCSLTDLDEFRDQAREQSARVEALFGVRPVTFRNTELVIDERIAGVVEELGFRALLGEGADHLLGWRSAHHVYRPRGTRALRLLLRDYPRSDDIAFRFSNRTWEEWPLSAERFARWVHAAPADHAAVNLFMDYETFGEHQWEETGIFRFFEGLPRAVLADPRFRFRTPGEVAAEREPTAEVAIPRPTSWADAERDVTAWLGNPMQRAANAALYAHLPAVRALAAAGEVGPRETWRKLSTSDHLYYMCTKWFSDGDVHKYFSPYATPHDAFIAFMNVVDDFGRRVQRAAGVRPEPVQTAPVIETT